MPFDDLGSLMEGREVETGEMIRPVHVKSFFLGDNTFYGGSLHPLNGNIYCNSFKSKELVVLKIFKSPDPLLQATVAEAMLYRLPPKDHPKSF